MDVSVRLPPATLPPRSRRRSIAPSFTEILPYNAGACCEPPQICIDLSQLTIPLHIHDLYSRRDFAWLLARFACTEENALTTFFQPDDSPQTVPSWSAFNASVQPASDLPSPSTVAYCLVTVASPTQMETVYTLLVCSVSMTKRLQQETTVIIVDQAVYAKALEVIWKRSDEFKSVVLRMGAFHTAYNFLAVIGKRYEGSGLHDLLLESGVVAEGSISGVLTGRHCNRAIRVHKLVMEALHRLQFQKFGEWCNDNDTPMDLVTVKRCLKELQTQCSEKSFAALIECEEFIKLHDVYADYLQRPMAQLWRSYINMVSLLLRFIRAMRQGHWEVHKACVRDTCFPGSLPMIT